MASVTRCFVFDTERDAALLAYLDSQDKRKKSEAARELMQRGLERGGGVTVGDVYTVVKDLERKLNAGAFVAHAGDESCEGVELSPGAADALGNLETLGMD
jgi:hypothetical protein